MWKKLVPFFDDYTSFFDFIFKTNNDWIYSINYFLIIHLKEFIIITHLICRKEENYWHLLKWVKFTFQKDTIVKISSI